MAGRRPAAGGPERGDELEVTLAVPERGARRTRRGLYEQLRTAIRSGRLAPGLRMPASRGLAQRLGVSRNTITAVYELLVSEGCLVTRPGSGAFVAEGPVRAAPRRPAHGMADRVRSIPLGWRLTAFDPTARYRFLLGLPDLAAFPWDLWRKIANRTLRAYGRGPIRPSGPQGAAKLREAIAGHLSFARGIACTPDDVVVASGAQQAFDILAKVLVHRPGVVVVLEDPGYPPIRAAFTAAGARIVEAPVDEEGILVDALPADAEVVCVTPSHQFPMGVAMSPPRRQALLAFARRTGAVVIEDDYDGDFRFDGRPLEALQTLDVSDQVLYVGTFSKSLFPDLRLGYVVAPDWAREALLLAKMATGGPSQTAQFTLAAFVAEGHLVRHVRRMRRIYAERRAALLEAFQAAPAGSVEPWPSAAGLHLALKLDPALDDVGVLRAATKLGVGAYALSEFSVGEGRRNGLVLGYGAVATENVRPGVEALVQAIRAAV